jgi:SAM-dependent methyltransferase
MITEISVREALGNEAWDDEEQAYVDLHSRRFAFLLNLLGGEFARVGGSREHPASFLDIGPHVMTGLIDRFFGDRIYIETLGWENPRLYYDRSHVRRHVQFDLNDADDRTRWPEATEHDVVLMAEVIEHLYTAPEQVLACLRRFVRPGGAFIIGTPNAVALPHRLKLVTGVQPYERIRLDRTGHFREYTAGELAEFAHTTGFRVRSTTFHEFMPSRSRLVRGVTRCVPTLRRMMTVILEREG